jgi:hypothetical protein
MFSRVGDPWAWGRGLEGDLVKVGRLVDRWPVLAAPVDRSPYRKDIWCSLGMGGASHMVGIRRSYSAHHKKQAGSYKHDQFILGLRRPISLLRNDQRGRHSVAWFFVKFYLLARDLLQAETIGLAVAGVRISLPMPNKLPFTQ